ncbi:MAG: hypothetical protein HZA88_16570 [Verrucomicrobia bacterium]|nr:hypothetical protein [Verrucomicrobiota bacterium]
MKKPSKLPTRLLLAAMLTLSIISPTACSTTKPRVIPADRLIQKTTLDGIEGYFVPPARMQEILRALADRRLEKEMNEAK